jgi:pimeloyl-ACP methyl ester carboxylesterase
MDRFKPTEVWFPDVEKFELEEPIIQARNSINQNDPNKLISDLKSQVEISDNKVTYAVLKGEEPEEYSQTHAAAMFNPYANGASSNMLVRSEFLREVFRFSDIRDEDGKLLPVIMLAAPGVEGSNVKLNKDEKEQIRRGELGPLAKELLRTVSERDIGRVTLLGFSLGADLALAGARDSFKANLEVAAISVGDPTGVVNRGLIKLIKDFYAAAPDLEERADKSGIDALRPAREEKGGYLKFLASTLYPINKPSNHKVLSGNRFEQNMQQILAQDKIDNLVIGYGSESTITRPADIEPAIQALYDRYAADSFSSIRVEGVQHTWGDQLTLLAKLYLRAFQ